MIFSFSKMASLPLSPPLSLCRQSTPSAFALLEVLLAIALFSFAILALGNTALSTLEAQSFLEQSSLLQQALSQEVEVVFASTTPPEAFHKKLEGPFQGIELWQTLQPVELKDEQGHSAGALIRVQLTATQSSGVEPLVRSVAFYVRR